MIFYAVEGHSSVSAEAAIASAIGEASVDYSKDAKAVHILIAGICQIGEEWVAIVRVIVETNLDEKLESSGDVEHKHVEKKEKKEDKEGVVEEVPYKSLFDEVQDIDHDPHIYVYTVPEYEDVYDFLPENLKESAHFYFHPVEEDDLWERMQNGFFPHTEFYEATHSEQLEHWEKFQNTLREINYEHKQNYKPKALELAEDI